jgi:hypothetical protein
VVLQGVPDEMYVLYIHTYVYSVPGVPGRGHMIRYTRCAAERVHTSTSSKIKNNNTTDLCI